jgi:SAM-dependent methyltransferase
VIGIDRYTDGNDASVRHWDESWKGWDAAAIDAAIVWEGMLPDMVRWFEPGSRLLEAGCGTGKYCVALEARGYRMTGVDYARQGIAVMRGIAPAIPVAVGSVLEMPFGDGEFDGALSIGVVEHFPEGPDAALAELARVVRPGGRVFLTVPLQNWLWDIWSLRHAPDAAPANGNGKKRVFYQYLHRRDEMGAALEHAGFAIHGVRYFARRLGLQSYLGGLTTVIGPPQAPAPQAATGLSAELKRRFPRATRAARRLEVALVERALPGPLCAHTICFLAKRR